MNESYLLSKKSIAGNEIDQVEESFFDENSSQLTVKNEYEINIFFDKKHKNPLINNKGGIKGDKSSFEEKSWTSSA